MNKPIVTSLLVALVVVGGVLAGGYFGLKNFPGLLQSGQPNAQHIIIELKDVAIGEIQSAKTEAIDDIKKLNTEVIAQVRQVVASAEKNDAAALEEMKKMVERLDANQKGLAERLTSMDETQAAPDAQMPSQDPAAGSGEGALTNTVYFPMAVAKGPKIDTQLVQIISQMKDHAGQTQGEQAHGGQSQCQINVSGFSDTLGKDDINLKLSQERADYVASKLEAEGLVIGNVRGWGERRLKVHTLDGADNKNNRRVVIEMNCTAAAPSV